MGSKITQIARRVIKYIQKNVFVLFVIFVYALFTCSYMGPSITSCYTTVYSFGDNTAGPVWSASLPEKQGLTGSFTSMTNAPVGDNLNSPIGYSLITQTVVIKTLQAVAGPICGYNIANMIGFTLSALIMFGFIYEVTKKKWIALLAGYAVSFAPYFQLKIGAHFSFGFQAIFIGIIWLFYRTVKYGRKRDYIPLGLLFATGIYFDPYYSLLVALTICPLVLVWLILNKKIFTRKFWQTKSDFLDVKKQFKALSTAAIIGLILVMPLVSIFLTQGQQISANVANSRGNVLLEAQYCSNWPHEYLVPFAYNPTFENLFGEERYHGAVSALRDHYSCGIGEDIVGLSITLATILFFGSVFLIWDRINKRKLGFSKCVSFDTKILIYGLAAVTLVALAVSFPPYKFHNDIPTPSYILMELTSTWRTLARIFVITNIGVVALAAIIMAYFTRYFKLDKRKLLAGVIFVAIFAAVVVEYQTAPPFSGNKFGTFSYKTSVPTHYAWLKSQDSIKTIAEYPLERSGGEGNSMAYYLSMQVSHRKKLFNGAISYSEQEIIKTALKNITDPQTVPVLKGMGVDAVVVHGVSKEELQNIPNIKFIHSSESNGFTVAGFSPLVSNDIVNIISLENVQPIDFVISLNTGFFRHMSLVKSATDWQYLASKGSVMKLQKLDGKKLNSTREVCFDIKNFVAGDVAVLSAKVDGLQTEGIVLSDNFQTVKYIVKDSIELSNSSERGMVLTKIGCN